MKKETISFNETGLFSKLICDFVNKDLGVKPLISSFFNKESVNSSFQKKSAKNRLILCSVLKEQYSHTSFMNPDLSHMYSNIDAISKHNTYTVTTGHQLNIFAGPLFLIYKILSVISYTNYLNQNINQYQFVPCFWMATEDHDLHEINNLKLYNKTYSSNLELKNCVGDLLSKPILKTLVTIKKLLNTSEYGEELYNIYEYAYKENLNYANATRSLLTTLFGDYGLVVIDGNNTHLKRIFIPDFN